MDGRKMLGMVASGALGGGGGGSVYDGADQVSGRFERRFA
jgi:hypothetical protein